MTIEITKRPAREIVALLRKGEISPLEVVDAAIERIEDVDSDVNALPIRCFEAARKCARTFDRKSHADNPRSLCGLPIAVKDYNDLAGALTTYGSPIFADNVAQKSDATVRKLQSNGAIAVAKSNVPEWAGGHTFNPVFGTTRNPWNTALSAGGSSGGSAAALASGQVWLATGNDLGGSLRTPAGFNGVVGLRPSPGLVPRGRRLPAMDTLWVEGPMARNVPDLAMMLDAGIGRDADDPLSFESNGPLYSGAIDTDVGKGRVAISANLGVVEVEPEISTAVLGASSHFSAMGYDVTNDIPDFSGVLEAFQTLRAVLFGTLMGPVLEKHRDEIAPEIIGNIERGLGLSSEDIFAAERRRIDLYHQILDFFEHHDFLICPTASIAPFPVEQRYVTEINGTPCSTYIDWFSITFALTMTACPVVSVPCGLTQSGMPIGVQIMGRPRGEPALLAFAAQFENAVGLHERLPISPK